MDDLKLDWRTESMDTIRWAYLRTLRSAAAGHRSGELDLVAERVLTERVTRETALYALAEKKGQLVNVEKLEARLVDMVVAFRTEVLALADKIKSDLDALHGINIEPQLLYDACHDCLSQLARYDPERAGSGASAGGTGSPARAHDHHAVGARAPAHEPQVDGPTGSLQP